MQTHTDNTMSDGSRDRPMLVLIAYLASLVSPSCSILFRARSIANVNHGLRIPFAYFLAFDLQTVTLFSILGCYQLHSSGRWETLYTESWSSRWPNIGTREFKTQLRSRSSG
ncbi:hypothetical protein LX36DRAFT_323745 [Colletotrichum falcatum]|nr:hypothetical protein LX36DRAFT_323745 [Colletotrichum falcatum]